VLSLSNYVHFAPENLPPLVKCDARRDRASRHADRQGDGAGVQISLSPILTCLYVAADFFKLSPLLIHERQVPIFRTSETDEMADRRPTFPPPKPEITATWSVETQSSDYRFSNQNPL
jgi:hypothetical protein